MFRVVVFRPQPPAVSNEETGLNSKQLSQISTKQANKSCDKGMRLDDECGV